MDELGQAQTLAVETCEKMIKIGIPITYIRSTFFPADSTCLCMFKADAARIVKKMNDDVALPYSEVVEAVDLSHP